MISTAPKAPSDAEMPAHRRSRPIELSDPLPFFLMRTPCWKSRPPSFSNRERDIGGPGSSHKNLRAIRIRGGGGGVSFPIGIDNSSEVIPPVPEVSGRFEGRQQSADARGSKSLGP